MTMKPTENGQCQSPKNFTPLYINHMDKQDQLSASPVQMNATNESNSCDLYEENSSTVSETSLTTEDPTHTSPEKSKSVADSMNNSSNGEKLPNSHQRNQTYSMWHLLSDDNHTNESHKDENNKIPDNDSAPPSKRGKFDPEVNNCKTDETRPNSFFDFNGNGPRFPLPNLPPPSLLSKENYENFSELSFKFMLNMLNKNLPFQSSNIEKEDSKSSQKQQEFPNIFDPSNKFNALNMISNALKSSHNQNDSNYSNIMNNLFSNMERSNSSPQNVHVSNPQQINSEKPSKTHDEQTEALPLVVDNFTKIDDQNLLKIGKKRTKVTDTRLSPISQRTKLNSDNLTNNLPSFFEFNHIKSLMNDMLKMKGNTFPSQNNSFSDGKSSNMFSPLHNMFPNLPLPKGINPLQNMPLSGGMGQSLLMSQVDHDSSEKKPFPTNNFSPSSNPLMNPVLAQYAENMLKDCHIGNLSSWKLPNGHDSSSRMKSNGGNFSRFSDQQANTALGMNPNIVTNGLNRSFVRNNCMKSIHRKVMDTDNERLERNITRNNDSMGHESHNLTSTLTPVHLRKAKLMFFYVRYPNSSLLKVFFPDVRFNKNNTAQLVKWFSNFREFYYIQMEKFARIAISDGVKHAEEIHVSTDSELYRALNLHYNRNQQIEVPPQFRAVVEATLKEFFKSLSENKDAEPSWKKPIYKIIARLDQPVPEFFKSPNWMERLSEN